MSGTICEHKLYKKDCVLCRPAEKSEYSDLLAQYETYFHKTNCICSENEFGTIAICNHCEIDGILDEIKTILNDNKDLL